MTITNDYQNCADWVAGYAHRKEAIQPHAVALLAQQLLDLADRVRHLEDVPLRLDHPDVVLPFKPKARTHAS